MARVYGRRRPKHRPNEDKGFWLTFSDLMSSMLLIFVLIMFYSVYQYFDMLEIKTAELMRQSGLLDQRQTELEQKTAETETAHQKLSESEKALINQQAQLLLSQQAQDEAESTLAERQKDLDTALALLDMQQQDLQAARELLSNQQTRLEGQQATLEGQQALLEGQQLRLDELVGVKARIVEGLAQALSSANVKAKVDETTGSIALDASVLFDLGKSDLKEGGKRVLDEFLPVYLDVLMSPENEANISEIIIEGHTDSVGEYMNNLRLSQARALSVMQYVLSDENSHLSEAMKARLRQIGTANGRSYSHLILDEQGGEDADASRRVEFKFRMQDEQMIQSMREILESMGSPAP